MKISTFIFIHDQQLILDYSDSGKFKTLPEVKYVFLGIGETDKIKKRRDVIIARELPNNIEHYPKFCSFTGWYALWKNNLIKSEYVHLLEYDIDVADNFNEVVMPLLLHNYDFIGYAPLSMRVAFISPEKYLSNLLPAIEKNYNICMKLTISSMLQRNKNAEWSSTSNGTFSAAVFNHYMVWFEKLIDAIKDDAMCGHAHERSISFFYLIHHKKIILMNKLISNLMLNSHHTDRA